MLSYVDKYQKLPPGTPTLFYPAPKASVNFFNFAVSAAGSKPVKQKTVL
jgi:hypothetical protein